MNYDLEFDKIDLGKIVATDTMYIYNSKVMDQLRQSVRVGIKIDDGALIPTYANYDDSGADIYTIEECYIAPNARGVKLRTGVKLDIPIGWEVQVRPKSGVSSKTPIRVVLGTVDSGYKGEIQIIVDNLSDTPVYIPKHKAVAQLVLQYAPMMHFEFRDEFADSTRGENGFGSTGRGIE